jgi:hypothetical protein
MKTHFTNNLIRSNEVIDTDGTSLDHGWKWFIRCEHRKGSEVIDRHVTTVYDAKKVRQTVDWLQSKYLKTQLNPRTYLPELEFRFYDVCVDVTVSENGHLWSESSVEEDCLE